MIIALLCIAALLAAPFAVELLRPRPSGTYSKGSFAKLPSGTTHYRWTGPEDGPVAVCIHGLTTPSYIFSGVARTLAALGYRVLTYDLYGRGLSDRPPGEQTPSFFLEQLRELLDDQGVTRRFMLVGYSMGASIAAALTAREGQRITSLVLLAPAGLAPVRALPLEPVMKLPIVGDWLMRAVGGWLIRRDLAKLPSVATMIPDLRERQADETRLIGYGPAVLSSARHILAQPFLDQHEMIRDSGVPVLAIWGRDDPVIPLKTLGVFAHLNPNAHHVEIAGAGHDFPQTHPAEVAEALKQFLKP